jgi:hypothetical protein
VCTARPFSVAFLPQTPVRHKIAANVAAFAAEIAAIVDNLLHFARTIVGGNVKYYRMRPGNQCPLIADFMKARAIGSSRAVARHASMSTF